MAIEQKALAFSAISLLSDVAAMLLAWPVLKFIGLGLVGGASGFFLAQETGRLDNLSRGQRACFLSRRLLLGACIGVMVFVGWAGDSEYVNMWLLAVCIISTSPIEMVKKIVEVAQSFITKKAGQ